MKKKLLWVLLSIVLYVVGIACGYVFFKYGKYYLVEKPKLAALEQNREQIDCDEIDTDKLMVALAFGQSNSANYGETVYEATQQVYNFHDGKCFLAKDPLLGATGIFGSVWTRFGDIAVQSGYFDSVLLVTVGVGGTEIDLWAPGGSLNTKLLAAIDQVESAGFHITHMFWHQGEQDSVIGTTQEHYIKQFQAMLASIRAKNIDAPIFPAVATMCRRIRESNDVQNAQRELPTLDDTVFPGPDTDALGLEFRYDGCHFSDEGLRFHAGLWMESVRRQMAEKNQGEQ